MERHTLRIMNFKHLDRLGTTPSMNSAATKINPASLERETGFGDQTSAYL